LPIAFLRRDFAISSHTRCEEEKKIGRAFKRLRSRSHINTQECRRNHWNSSIYTLLFSDGTPLVIRIMYWNQTLPIIVASSSSSSPLTTTSQLPLVVVVVVDVVLSSFPFPIASRGT
jgi:hypothetical protein